MADGLKDVFPVLTGLDQLGFGPLALRDVEDQGIKQILAAQTDRTAVDLHVVNGSVGPAVPKLEEILVHGPGPPHGLGDFLAGQGVDVGHPFGPHFIAGPAVVAHRRRVGVDDPPLGRVDDEHRGVVVVEKALVVAAGFAQPRLGGLQPDMGAHATEQNGRGRRPGDNSLDQSLLQKAQPARGQVRT